MEHKEYRSVNKSVRKKDAMQLLTGKPVYTDDVTPADALVVKLLRSPHANAVIEEINTSIAKKVPGVVDIFTWQEGKLSNISLSENGVSTGTLRSGSAACRDLDGDGIPEVPIPRALNSQSDTVFRVLDWYGYNSLGKRTLRFTTYHNYSDSWYLTLPEEWGDSISIRREEGSAGERAVIFSRWLGQDRPVQDFLAIYTLSGDHREALAQQPGRFILYRGAESVCVGQLLPEASEWSLAPTEEYLRNHFYPIYSEWISGRR